MALKGPPTRTKGNEKDGKLARSRADNKYHSHGGRSKRGESKARRAILGGQLGDLTLPRIPNP